MVVLQEGERQKNSKTNKDKKRRQWQLNQISTGIASSMRQTGYCRRTAALARPHVTRVPQVRQHQLHLRVRVRKRQIVHRRRVPCPTILSSADESGDERANNIPVEDRLWQP